MRAKQLQRLMDHNRLLHKRLKEAKADPSKDAEIPYMAAQLDVNERVLCMVSSQLENETKT